MPKVRAPSRQLDEFEQLVYHFSARMEWGNKDDHWDIDGDACNLRFESATRSPRPHVSFRFNVAPKLCNFMGNIHGGCAATLIDILSTTILMGIGEPGKFSLGGVSRHLNVTYLRPVPQDTEVRLSCEVVHVGRRLALLKAEISRVDNGDVCIVGEHEKANTDPEAGGKV
ncbi:putative thioesterase family protein [Aspergillus ambiguus]|uniref:PaaI family thioesterase n=1 Tax=Aspergillus ambiguus TaxID=176160 RepID=UPI003CCE3E0F